MAQWLGGNLADGIERIERIEQIAHMLMIAHER